MKSKTFVVLLIVCVVLGLAAYLTLREESPSRSGVKMGTPFFEELPVGEITGLEIISPESRVELNKPEDHWVVQNRFEYPADFGKINELVKKLKEMKIGRSFKATEDRRQRLALFPPKESGKVESEKGTRLAIKNKKMEKLGELILGESRKVEGGSGGQYVLRSDGDTIYLVDQNFRYIQTDPAQWLDKKLVEAPRADVKTVTCIDPETGEKIYSLKRPEKGKDPELVDKPSGGKLTEENLDEAKVNRLFGALSAFRIDDVADPVLENDKTGFDVRPNLVYELFDGTSYTVRLGSPVPGDDTRYYFAMNAKYTPPETSETVEETGESETEQSGEKDVSEEEKKAEEARIQKEREKLAAAAKEKNLKFSKWIYIIGKWRKDNFITEAKQLIKEKEEKTGKNG
jgi:hypothetical protein